MNLWNAIHNLPTLDPGGDGDCIPVARGHNGGRGLGVAVGDDHPRTDALVAVAATAAVFTVTLVCVVALGGDGDDDHGVDRLLRRERSRTRLVVLRLLLRRRLWSLLGARRSELDAGARFNRTILISMVIFLPRDSEGLAV